MLSSGLLSIIISILWLLQLGLYTIPKQFTENQAPIALFLNSMLIGANDVFTVFSIVFVSFPLVVDALVALDGSLYALCDHQWSLLHGCFLLLCGRME